MLRIAVPNKGSLADSSISILKEAGYRQRSDSRDLVLIDPENSVEFYYLRPRDIAIYVGTGELEAGITGRDLLIDSGATSEEILSLDFGRSTFRFAAPVGKNMKLADISGKRVATAYPRLSGRFLEKECVDCICCQVRWRSREQCQARSCRSHRRCSEHWQYPQAGRP